MAHRHGATDNADGSATVIEAMRILKALNIRPRRTIRAALWAGEEQGLLGSKAYVTQHLAGDKNKAARDKFSVYFNLDNGYPPISGFYMENNDPARAIMAEWLKPMANIGAIMPAPGHIGATDHLSFLDVGVPGFQAVQEYINYDVRTHHTNADTAERIDPNALKQAATVMAAILYQASMREGTFPKPAPPKTSQKRNHEGHKVNAQKTLAEKMTLSCLIFAFFWRVCLGAGPAADARSSPARGGHPRRRPGAVCGVGAGRLSRVRAGAARARAASRRRSASRYYGAEFTRRVVEPGLRQLKADHDRARLPRPRLVGRGCRESAMTLVDEAMRGYNIDRKRVLVVGYSMGGRGTWYMASQHPDLFTAAIPMAASTRGLTVDQLSRQPTYVIHSRADEVVPFDPAEKNARDLKKLKREVEFEALDDFTHFDMVSYVDALQRAGRWVARRWKDR